MLELRVAVIASHNGSNLRALHRASLVADAQFRVVLVISNNSDSGALRYAGTTGSPPATCPGAPITTRTKPSAPHSWSTRSTWW
ncbi:hypothetical protein [Nocardia gipuzkoensis]